MQTEADFINVDVEEEQEITYIKPKKQLSEQQLQHLAVIREKALQKKKEMKVITEKANKIKEFETMKVAKQLQKKELAKQYDEMMFKQYDEGIYSKPEAPKIEAPKVEKDRPSATQGPDGSGEVKPTIVKPEKKKKIIKKVIYQEASSSDSDGADEVEVVKVKKSHKQPIVPKQRDVEEAPPKKENSYTNLLYESSLDKMRTKMMDERAKYLVNSLLPQYN